eukprot:scaffold377_cov269-Pinguiococcus_pyrenoidosus.AAC.1
MAGSWHDILGGRDWPTAADSKSPGGGFRKATGTGGMCWRTVPSPPPEAASEDADLREDPDGQDHHARCGAVGHHRECEDQDSGQRGHSARSAAPHLRRQAAGGRAHAVGLQHPEGVHAAPGAAAAWWRVRPGFGGPGEDVQL